MQSKSTSKTKTKRRKPKCTRCHKKCSLVDALIYSCGYCKKQFCKNHAIAFPKVQMKGHLCLHFNKVQEQHQQKLTRDNPTLEETHRMLKV